MNTTAPTARGRPADWRRLAERAATLAVPAVLAAVALTVLGGAAHALPIDASRSADLIPVSALAVPPAPPTPSAEPSPTTPAPAVTPTPTPTGPSPTPMPGQPASPAPGGTSGSGGGSESKPEPCSMFDLGCKAREGVTDWFRELVKTASKPTFDLLGSTVLATPDMNSADMSRARQLWGTSQTIANTCFVLLVSLGGVLLMSGTTLPYEMGIKDLLPRLVAAFSVANLSQILLGYGIGFANGLANAFLQAGGHRIDPAQAADVLGRGVEASINTGGVFLILVALVVVILAVCVAFVYVVRLAITMVLIAAAPIALIFHALPQTEGISVLWWRAITGLLAIQVCQSLVFVTALQLLFTQDAPDKGTGSFHGFPTTKHDVIDLLMMICLLWILIRIPHWVSRAIWRQGRSRATRHIMTTVVAYRATHRMFHHATHRSHRSRRTGGQGPGGHGNSGSGGGGRTGGGGSGSGAGGGGGGGGGRSSGGGGGSAGGGGSGHGGHAGGGGRHGGNAGGSGRAGGSAGGSGSQGSSHSTSGAGGGPGGGGRRPDPQQQRNRGRYERHRDRYRHQERQTHRPPDPHQRQRRHRTR